MNRRFKLEYEVESGLQEIRQQFLQSMHRRAWLGMAGWTLAAVLCWVLPKELFPTLSWLHLLGMAAGIACFSVGILGLFTKLRQKVTTQQIARYIDENHPHLQDRLTAMVALDAGKERDSYLLVKKFLEESQTTIGREGLLPTIQMHRKAVAPLPVWLLFGLAGVVLFWHVGKHASFWPQWQWMGTEQAFQVKPGDAKVRPGEDLSVLVKFEQLNQTAAKIFWRSLGSPWQETLMQAGSDTSVYFHKFSGIEESIEYRVEAGEDVSPTYLVRLWQPPEVESIDLVYHYPDYLNLPKREVAFSGHITAVEGTRVVVKAAVSKELKTATMILASGESVSLKNGGDQTFIGELTISQNDSYHLALVDHQGEANPSPAHYDIVVQPDKPPVVNIDFPRADMEVSLLDEVGFDFKVSDDYGLQDYGLRYQVAGRDPVWVSLKTDKAALEIQATGRHQLMLEDMDLAPGDLVTWTVYAKDQKPNRPEYQEMAEPYFLEIRPFKREFREAITQAGLQAGGPQADLVQKQKEVLIATWNLRKKASEMTPEDFEKDRARIHQAEVEVLEAVNKSMQGEGGSGGDDSLPFHLADAVTHLEKAQLPEPEAELTEAADSAQRAFQMLLKMMPNQSQVSRSRQRGGGGGGNQSQAMNELEMNRNRNFYEEERLTQKEQEATAEALQEIKDLARRQKMLNDEIAKLISEQEQQKDDEAMRRKLERLEEELQKSLEQLDETQRDLRQSQMDGQAAKQTEQQLDQARQDLQKALDAIQKEQLQQARSASKSASSKLDKTSRDLGEQTLDSTEERMTQLQKEFAEMKAMQEAIEQALQQRDAQQRTEQKLSGEGSSDDTQQSLMDQKKELGERFKEAMERASKLADLTAGDQELLSRKMGDWLRETSKEGVGEAIEETNEMVRYGMWEGLEEKESEISQKLDQVAKKLDTIATMSVGDETQAVEKSLEALQQLQKDWQANAGENQEQAMERFASGTYREWLDTMRDVDDLLPEDHRSRQRLNTIRREIEKTRKEFRRDRLTPQYDLFMEQISKPLGEVIESLVLDVARLRKEREFVLVDDGSVPDRYRKQVADYFEALSHAERNPNQ